MKQDKTCPRCEITKPLSEYYNSSSTLNGKTVYCKMCQREKDRSPRSRFSQVKNKAKTRGIAWGMTFEEFSIFIGQKCSYCGGPTPTTGLGLDRINSSLGYTFANSVPCCAACNHIKHQNFTFEEMKVIGRSVVEIRQMRGLAPDQAILMQHQLVKDRRPYRPRRKGGNKENGYLPVKAKR
jgi:hypothetical protein